MEFPKLKKFIASVAPDLKVILGWTPPYAALLSHKSNTIVIDRVYFYKTLRHRPIEAQALMLHEIGHYAMNHTGKMGNAIKELEAQVWAIKEAKKRNMPKTRKYLVSQFRSHTTKNLKWNGPFRKYILARRLFLKRKMRY